MPFLIAELQKLVGSCGVLCMALENVFRATAACNFFEIGTSKIATNLMCFVHFDLKMRFPPQRGAIFHSSAEQLPQHPPLDRAYFSNTAIRDFPSVDLLSSDLSAFQLSILNIVGRYTSKLPSTRRLVEILFGLRSFWCKRCLV